MEINLASDDHVAETKDRLAFHKQEVITVDDEVRVEDPWGNLIRIRATK